MRIVKPWNRLSKEIVGFPSLELLQTWGFGGSCEQPAIVDPALDLGVPWIRLSPEVPSSLIESVTLFWHF